MLRASVTQRTESGLPSAGVRYALVRRQYSACHGSSMRAVIRGGVSALAVLLASAMSRNCCAQARFADTSADTTYSACTLKRLRRSTRIRIALTFSRSQTTTRAPMLRASLISG